VSESEPDTEITPHHHKQITLSLSFQLQIKSQNSSKSSRTQNPNRFPEIKFKLKPWNQCELSEIQA